MIWDFLKYSNRIALKADNGECLTYKEMYDECARISGACNGRSLVFCLCENVIGSVLGYSAFVNSNIVPVMLNAHMDRELLEDLIEKYCPQFLWSPNYMLDDLSMYGLSVYESYGYNLLKTDFEKVYPLHDELCLMLTTSGSTGSPKFVRQSYRNVESNAKSIAEYLELNENERPITTLPMNYTYGLSIINSHFLVGATILLTDKGLMQKEFWDFFKLEKATSFGGVPYTYEMLDRLRFFRMELPSLRYMTQAGGKITKEFHEKIAKYAESNNKKFIVMYGQCEATARMGYLPADKALERCGSMGIAIPGGLFRLIDSEGQEINEPEITGELVYEGPNVTLGYAECGSDLIKGDERNGKLFTGDMALRDKDGFYYIVGRKKRFLKIYGNRVNLDEIDRMIKGKYEIEVASAGVDDHMYIFVTKQALADEVREFVISKTKLNPAAFKVIVIDEVPKNDSGKILYKELAKYYEK